MYLEQKIDRILEILEARGNAPSETQPPPKRGRPAKIVEASTVPVTPVAESVGAVSAAPVAATAPIAEADPFAEAVAPAPLVVTKDQVREAAVALSKATTQDNAVAVIKAATGVSYPELKPEQYATAYVALVNANAPRVADPFALGAPAPATVSSGQHAVPAGVQTDAPSLDDVKAAIRKAQARTGANQVQAVVIAHGGVAIDTNPGPTNGTKKVSVNALPVPAYAAVIAAVNALPDTKTGK